MMISLSLMIKMSTQFMKWEKEEKNKDEIWNKIEL
jgi:hypothetical protein